MSTAPEQRGTTMNPTEWLANYNAATESLGETIYCRTRTGKRVHLGSPGSSVTYCGHWLRYNAAAYRIDPSRVDAEHVCQRCIDPERLAEAAGAASDAEQKAAGDAAEHAAWQHLANAARL